MPHLLQASEMARHTPTETDGWRRQDPLHGRDTVVGRIPRLFQDAETARSACIASFLPLEPLEPWAVNGGDISSGGKMSPRV